MKKSSGKLDVEILSKNSGFPKKWKNKEFSLFSPGLGRRCAFGKRCVFTWMCSFCCLKKIPSLLLSSVFSFPFFSFLFFLYVFLFFFCSFSLFENDFLNSFNFEAENILFKILLYFVLWDFKTSLNFFENVRVFRICQISKILGNVLLGNRLHSLQFPLVKKGKRD